MTEWHIAITEWRQEHLYEYLTRVNFAPVLVRALGKLNPEAIIAGYRATGLFPFNVEAVHFEKLTTGSAKRKYSRVPHVEAIMHPSTTAPTNDQIVMQLKRLWVLMFEYIPSSLSPACNKSRNDATN